MIGSFITGVNAPRGEFLLNIFFQKLKKSIVDLDHLKMSFLKPTESRQIELVVGSTKSDHAEVFFQFWLDSPGKPMPTLQTQA